MLNIIEGRIPLRKAVNLTTKIVASVYMYDFVSHFTSHVLGSISRVEICDSFVLPGISASPKAAVVRRNCVNFRSVTPIATMTDRPLPASAMAYDPRRLVLHLVLLNFFFTWGDCFVSINYKSIRHVQVSSFITGKRCLDHNSQWQLASSPSGGEGNLPLRNKDDNDEDDGDDDDDTIEDERPYRNRSLAWTRKYRQLVSYEYARRCAMDLGLRSQEDWEEYCQDGKVYHGPYLVSRPDLMYPDDWVSWDEFLGVMRPYSETQQLVRMLQLQTPDEYHEFVFDNPKRAEGLRIPAQPHIVYRDKGWSSWEAFLNPSLDREET